MIERKEIKEIKTKGVQVTPELELILDPDRVENYFKDKSINNSLLNLCFTPKWIQWKRNNPDVQDQDKRHFIIGSAVDCLLTDPGRWDKEFFVYTNSKPGGFMGIFIDALPTDWEFRSDEDKEIAYDKAYKLSGFKRNKDAVIKSLHEHDEYRSYFMARQLANGKKILSVDEQEEVFTAVEAIKSITEIKDRFFPLSGDTPDRRVYHQVDVYFEYDGVICKALMDGLIIDHVNKRLIPFDLKTVAKPVMEFEQSFWGWSYYRQAAYYLTAIKRCPAFQAFFDQGYTIGYPLSDGRHIAFEFAVAPKKEQNDPALMFLITDELLKIGEFGGTTVINGINKTVKGFKELISCYLWHQTTNIWSAPKWIYENNYSVILDKK